MNIFELRIKLKDKIILLIKEFQSKYYFESLLINIIFSDNKILIINLNSTLP